MSSNIFCESLLIEQLGIFNNLVSSNNVAIGTAAGETMIGAWNTAIGAYSDMATNTWG
jgi:hypothetical protein